MGSVRIRKRYVHCYISMKATGDRARPGSVFQFLPIAGRDACRKIDLDDDSSDSSGSIRAHMFLSVGLCSIESHIIASSDQIHCRELARSEGSDNEIRRRKVLASSEVIRRSVCQELYFAWAVCCSASELAEIDKGLWDHGITSDS
jgi:hypothetical protein